MKSNFFIFWRNKLKFIAICLVLHIMIIFNGFTFKEGLWSAPAMFEQQLFTPTDLIFKVSLHNCSFAKKYHYHIINASVLRNKNYLNDYQERLFQVFKTCDMKDAKIFFSQINDDQKIYLNNFLKEEKQIKNIINYYYLIEPKSLLSEMKRMNYQSRDALLIIEKLEIDINWTQRYDLKGIDEHFNRLWKKI